jgi:uncharacterized protein YifE (UPF0438 family)
MAKISRAAAEAAAAKIVKPLRDKVVELRNQMSITVRTQYLKEHPKEVVDLFHQHSDYFYKNDSLTLYGHGFNSYHVGMRTPVPADCNSSKYVLSSPEQGKELTKLRNEIDNAKSKVEDTETNIVNTILSLGTYKRVLDAMPEVAPYLPNPGNNTTSLMLNTEPLRAQIKELIGNIS